MKSVQVLVRWCELAKKRNGELYIRLRVLTEEKKEVPAVIWDSVDYHWSLLKVGCVYIAVCDRTTYNGVINLTIYSLSVVENPDLSVFGLVDKTLAQSKWNELVISVLSEVTDPDYRSLLKSILSDSEVSSKLIEVPATLSQWYSWPGGLFDFICDMLDVGLSLCKVFSQINKDLLVSLIVVHDLGKIYEYASLPGSSFSKSLEGELVGHTGLGIRLLHKFVDTYNPKISVLEHAILAHHYGMGYDSTASPKVYEVELLSYIRSICILMNDYSRAVWGDDGWSLSLTGLKRFSLSSSSTE